MAVPFLFLAAAVAGPTFAPPPSARALTVASGLPPARSFLIVENAGQFDAAVRYQARAAGMTIWVTETSLWLTKVEPGSRSVSSLEEQIHSRAVQAGTADGPRRGVNLEVTFPGRRAGARLVASDRRPTRMNYFLGSDPRRWHSGVRTYGQVTWRGLYPEISLTLTEIGGQPALAVDVAPGADPAALRLRVAGAEAVRATNDGRLIADTAIGTVFLPPVVRGGQGLGAEAHESDVAFTRATSSDPSQGSSLSAGGARPARGLVYGTFLGSGEDDFGSDLVVGPDGSTYLTGWTYSADFPTTPGAFDRTYDGPGGFGGDAFVSKLDPTGSSLAYSTFLGGSDTDTASSLALGPDGAAYVGGATASADFPTTPGAYDTTYDGGDGFVTKLDAQGAALVFSTFLGGGTGDSIDASALASDGTIYATGETFSADFPTTPGAFDRTLNSPGDSFVTALNEAGTDLVYSTFLGGDHSDIGYAITVGRGGTAYVTGETQSRDFPTTPGAFDETFNGGNDDAFVTRVNPDGTALVFSTYLGGSDSEDGQGITVDPDGNAYVVGDSLSSDYPITPGAYDPTITGFLKRDAIVTKLNRSGSALVYSTFLGGDDYDSGRDLSAAPDGTLTLTGTTYSANFPTTPGAFDRTLGGSGDAFVARFDPAGSALLYGSFLGGTGFVIDEGLALAPAKPGAVSVSGDTSSANFPVTPRAYDPTYNGEADAFVATLRVARTMHVDAIVPRYRPVGSGYAVGAAIRILYEDGSPVRGADVTVEIAYPDGTEVVVTGQTGSKGIAAVARPASDSGTYTFTVLDVALLGPVYDPSQNRETTDSVTIP